MIAAVPKIICDLEGWDDRTDLHGVTASSVVHFMPVGNNFFGVAVLSADSLSGSVILGYIDNPPIKISLPSQGERAYQVQTERISNLVVYSDGVFFWANLHYTGAPRWIKLLDGDAIDTGDEMIAIALSSNKAVVLYDGRVEYYGIFGEDDGATVGLFFSEDFTGSEIDDVGVYKFSINCVCQTLKRFSCYSSTLNCLLIKKAGYVCGGQDLPGSP